MVTLMRGYYSDCVMMVLWYIHCYSIIALYLPAMIMEYGISTVNSVKWSVWCVCMCVCVHACVCSVCSYICVVSVAIYVFVCAHVCMYQGWLWQSENGQAINQQWF